MDFVDNSKGGTIVGSGLILNGEEQTTAITW